MVTKQDFINILSELGVRNGDMLLTHSSFKSLGGCENGADTVVTAMLEAVGSYGTVVFPTLCQQDWENVYKNWHIDASSDVGYLTNYFRLLPEAKRSNQATHSVAAIGKHRDYLTETHGESGKRYGIFGDTPFSKDSPWQKMYELDTKVLFIGVGIRKCTFRHLAEYIVVDEALDMIKGKPEHDALKAELWYYGAPNQGVWPHVSSPYIETILAKEGKVKYAKCGDADLILVSSRDFVDCAIKHVKERDINVFTSSDTWCPEDAAIWLDKVYSVCNYKV